MAKLYIASKWDTRFALREKVKLLTAHGHEIVSSWIYRDEDEPVSAARRDVDDVQVSDILIYIGGSTTTGGKSTELGLALGLGIPVIVVGESTNIFTTLADLHVEQFEDLPAAIDTLEDA